MLTIKKLSSTGFQTLNNTWYSVDVMKILKNKKFKYPFESLKIGDVLDDLKFQTGKNNKEYVIDFIVIPHDDIGVKEDSPLHAKVSNNSLNPLPSPVNIQDAIRYAQCVNIAFEHTTVNGFETEEKWINFSFNRADKIYIEFNKRCSK